MMRTFLGSFVLCCLPLLAGGCSSTDSGNKAEGQKTGDAGRKTGDAGSSTGEVWERIIDGTWSLAPSDEDPRFCVKKELTEDVYIHAIRPVHPKGTHHTLLTLGDGAIDCTTAVAQGLIYAAGIGSEGLTLPEGVAIKLPKGKFLNLGLHIYNTTEEELTGTSGMEVVTMKAEDVKYESEALLAGPFTLSLPPQKESIVKGECQVTADQHLYALFPHMHQWGKHLKTTLTIGGVEQVIHDGPYDFNEQYQLPLDPIIDLKKGDKVTTECTFDNTTSKTIGFGESSDTEMCFSVLFRYPKQGAGFCAGNSGQRITLPGPPCAKDGDVGNEVGVGKQCTRAGGECNDNSDSTICLADYADGQFPNYCTKLCSTNDECGAGAVCRKGSSGQAACAPAACVASVDGGAPKADVPDAG